jgi:hypothetical protein
MTRAEELERAISNMLKAAKPNSVLPPYLDYVVPTGHLTVLSRMVNDGCTYKEAVNG